MSRALSRVVRSLIAAAMICLLLVPVAALAKEFSISSINIGAVVDPNGDLRVTEDRTVDFSGSFSWMQWALKTTGSQGIAIQGVSVMSGGTEQPLARTDEENAENGTFTVAEDGERVLVRVNYEVTDQELPLRITYTARGAAKRYRDVCELYWKFIGDETEVAAGPVHIEVTPPSPGELMGIWAHGPLTGTITSDTAGLVKLDVPELPAKTFVEARILYPPTALPDAPLAEEERLQTVLSEEAAWAQEANAIRRRARLRLLLIGGFSALLSLAGAGLAWWAFLKFGREYKAEFPGGYLREDPRPDLPPAVVGAIWRMGTVTDADVAATLMDLADKKIVAMRPVTEHKEGLFGGSDETTFELGLNPERKLGSIGTTDKLLLDLLFEDIGAGGTVRLSEIKTYAKDHPRAFADSMQKWKDECQAVAEALGMFETNSWSWQIGMYVLAALVATVGVFSAIWAEHFLPLCLAVPATIVIVVSAIYMRRRSRAGNELYVQYKAVNDFLRDFSRLHEAPPQSIILWNRFLVLAVVFGIGAEVIRQLQVKMPEVVNDPGFQTMYWWVYAGPGGTSPVSSLQSGIASAAQIAASENSSASGGGGGFSGGGGGGGGGGGFSAG